MISKIEVERFTLSSSKPFDQVVAALDSAVGHPDISEFWKSTHRAQSAAELQSTIEKVLGQTGLMLFAEFDHGAIVQKVVWATHFAPAADLFTQKLPGTAWKSKPSWYIVATKDRTVHPELQRFVAKRMGASTTEVESSHVPMLSKPNVVIDVIRAAAKSIGK
jgi:pimeloyl-ACP methyl ester carboxylesterase